MTDSCERLHAYIDDELAADDRIAFETHLATCDACGHELPRLLAVMAALDDAAAAAADAKSGAPRLALVPGAGDAAAEPTGGSRGPASARPKRRLQRWIATGLAGALAAAAAALLVIHPAAPPAPPVIASLADQLGPTRSIEPRLSYPGADRYRPLDVARGARSSESISIERMGQLEHAKDLHGVAVAALLAGERERAARFFALAPPTPQVDSDRAVLELMDGSQDALERALDNVDRALKAAPNNPAALWNRSLVLAALNLPLASARELDRVVALGEPGWADEAKTRAASLRAAVLQRRTRWQQADAAGQRLIEDGTPVPVELLAVTGYMTTILYDAVRAAPSRARVEALLPMATVLDSAYRSDHLTAYVKRIAATDFRVRKPLAEAYRRLITSGHLPEAAIDPFLNRLEQSHLDDIWMGAAVWTGRVTSHLESYRRRATASNDPWFLVVAEQEATKAEIVRGELSRAERRLREALTLARRERLAYRVVLVEYQLSGLLRMLRQPSQVAREAQLGYRDAITDGSWLREMNALSDLAASNLQRYANDLARAYLTELLERSDSSVTTGGSLTDERYDCARRQYAYQSLASISLLFSEPERARGELSAAPKCHDKLTSPDDLTLQRALTLGYALVWSELHRFSHQDEDARLAHNALAVMRADPSTTTSEQALLSYIEAGLIIDIDRTAGQRSLRQSIVQAGDQTDDLSVKARAYSFSLLALDAGQTSQFAEVIDLLAKTLEVPKPDMCAVAIAVQEDRSVVAFSDARGETGGQYIARRTSGDLDASTLIPASITERLTTCARVTVLARAPVLGAGKLFPPEVAWSYVLKGAPATAPPTATHSHRLVVANPETPPDLNLPPLGPYPDLTGDIGTTLLRGADATATRVIRAMTDASIIEFHTHGIIANDISEASYIVLSPELDRQYTLTARDVAQIRLKAAPLVILGSCHAATSSRSLEGGMGLAESFLRSGARAVIASPDAVPDLRAHEFFATIRDRVMQGINPAIAVRDERIRRLAAFRDDPWVPGVVVFE